MKSNVEMIRKMGDFDVIQRSKDGMFNANALLRQWSKIKGNPRRKMGEFLNKRGTKEYIEILKIRGGRKADNVDYQPVILKKGRMMPGKGQLPDSVWMDSYLFLDFAMYINVEFKADVIEFISDNLIAFRNEAGDNHNKLMSLLPKKITKEQRMILNKALNQTAFGKHHKDIRNKASVAEMNELNDIAGKLIYSIEAGFVKNFSQLMDALRNIWTLKYNPIRKIK